MNIKEVTFLTMAVKDQNKKVWIGISPLSRSTSVGIKREDQSIWTGYLSFAIEERSWPNFVTSWYTAQVYVKALMNCLGLTAGNPLLSKCPSVFKIKKVPYENDNTTFVVNFLTNKEQDIEEVLSMKPPIEYIEQVVAKSEELGILFEVDLLRSFLTENYQDVPDSLWDNLQKYELWRKKLASY